MPLVASQSYTHLTSSMHYDPYFKQVQAVISSPAPITLRHQLLDQYASAPLPSPQAAIARWLCATGLGGLQADPRRYITSTKQRLSMKAANEAYWAQLAAYRDREQWSNRKKQVESKCLANAGQSVIARYRLQLED
eukprot:CAMPEP_0168323234 /NCGR_PEP_ID=MMETSP0213-20121227/3365_1 /TAXON_ID=151035 /ORGANISM="Euplotes harpa, Strain FSP1.4" /LENGTH=135 /DNA_ID=CAMNT_0008325277 /DNA_START=149 /DNA_END=557 /DNA_ORIENTATION=-